MNVFLSLMFKNIFCDIKALALLCILNKCSSLLLTSLPSDSVSSPFPKSDLFLPDSYAITHECYDKSCDITVKNIFGNLHKCC